MRNGVTTQSTNAYMSFKISYLAIPAFNMMSSDCLTLISNLLLIWQRISVHVDHSNGHGAILVHCPMLKVLVKHILVRPVSQEVAYVSLYGKFSSYSLDLLEFMRLSRIILCLSIRTGNETFSDNRTVTYEQSWTYEGCLPVFTNSIDPKNGNSHSAYYDTTIGISDPGIFIPPKQCLTDEEYRLRHTLFGAPIDPRTN